MPTNALSPECNLGCTLFVATRLQFLSPFAVTQGTTLHANGAAEHADHCSSDTCPIVTSSREQAQP